MPFVVPQITHSSYKELVREAMNRIPVHTPEWISQNDSDPGITLIQLFAHLTEVLNYRCNLIPERNRAKFLQLLRLPLRPAQPARGLVAFGNPRGVIATENLSRETLVRAGRIEFRTQNALSVLPIEGRLYIKSRLPDERRAQVEDLYLRLYPDLVQEGTTLDYYETQPLALPTAGVTLPVVDLVEGTADASLWIALLARRTDSPRAVRDEIAHKVLTIGVLPAQDTSELELPPAGFQSETADGLLFQIPRLQGSSVRYERLESRPSASLLTQAGTVELRLPDATSLTYAEDLDPLEPGVSNLPPSLADTDDAERLITWIRIRAPEVENAGQESQLAARFSWVGINAAEILQRAWVRSGAAAGWNRRAESKGATAAHARTTRDPSARGQRRAVGTDRRPCGRRPRGRHPDPPSRRPEWRRRRPADQGLPTRPGVRIGRVWQRHLRHPAAATGDHGRLLCLWGWPRGDGRDRRHRQG